VSTVLVPPGVPPGAEPLWAGTPQERAALERANRPGRPPSGVLVAVLILPYPIWWLLGMGTFILPVLAIGMVVALWRARPVKLPPGFVLWGLFLVTVFVSIPMATINPPQTLANHFGARLPAIALRIVLYLSAAILLLYVYNSDRAKLSDRRLIRMLGLMFVITVAGGYLGIIAPKFAFTSPVEDLLPYSVRTNILVSGLVHPNAAQLQNVFGYSTPRPAAPFGFTNTWGNNFGVLLPWFVVGFVIWARGWRRWLAVGFALAALVPVIYSLNRGLWLGLLLAGAWLVFRLLARGNIAGLVIATGALAVAALVLVATPLSSVIGQRLESGKSNDVRTFTTEQTLQVFRDSPVIGFGTTRTALGGAHSVTVGKTASCTGCGNPTLGSNGQLWLVLISQGLLGVFCYVGFHVQGVFRFFRRRDPVADAGTAMLVMALLFMLFYNAVSMAMSFELLGYAAMARYYLPRRVE
jgi:O-antigen ligase